MQLELLFLFHRLTLSALICGLVDATRLGYVNSERSTTFSNSHKSVNCYSLLCVKHVHIFSPLFCPAPCCVSALLTLAAKKKPRCLRTNRSVLVSVAVREPNMVLWYEQPVPATCKRMKRWLTISGTTTGPCWC